MIYLVLAILSSSMISVIMRLCEKRVKNEMFMFTANYAVCAILSAALGGRIAPQGGSTAVLLGVISGIMYLVTFVLLKVNISKSGVVLSSMFMKLGVLVPALMAIAVFGERPDIYTILGFALALIAIVFVNGAGNKAAKSGGSMLLIVLLLVGGFTDSFANIYDKLGTAQHKDFYLLVTFAVACAASITAGLIKGQRPGIREIAWGSVLGIPNYFCSRFMLGALSQLDAMVVYPVFNAGVILIISLSGVLGFKERLSKGQWAGLALIPAALVLLNI